MKKLIAFLSAIVVLLMFLVGCAQKNVKLQLIDSVTNFPPITKKIEVNGKEVQMNAGELIVPEGKCTISADGYNSSQVTIDKSTDYYKLLLEPLAYLTITTNVSEPQINIDGVKAEYRDFVAVTNSVEYFKSEHTIYISPAPLGNHSLKIASEYFKDSTLDVYVKEGVNNIKLILLPDTAKVSKLIDSITFPEDIKDFDFNIRIVGILNDLPIDNSLSGKISMGTIAEISDENIKYDFIDDKPYVDNKSVTDDEELSALIFARDTVNNFLSFKEKISSLSILLVKDGSIVLAGERDFEGRKFGEHVSIDYEGNSIYNISLGMDSDELKTHLTVDISINNLLNKS